MSDNFHHSNNDKVEILFGAHKSCLKGCLILKWHNIGPFENAAPSAFGCQQQSNIEGITID